MSDEHPDAEQPERGRRPRMSLQEILDRQHELADRCEAAGEDDSDIEVTDAYADFDADAFIDSIDPADLRDATHGRRIVAAGRAAIERGDLDLLASIATARAHGYSWRLIGAFLGDVALDARRALIRRSAGSLTGTYSHPDAIPLEQLREEWPD